jgi:hypothetical protein
MENGKIGKESKGKFPHPPLGPAFNRGPAGAPCPTPPHLGPRLAAQCPPPRVPPVRSARTVGTATAATPWWGPPISPTPSPNRLSLLYPSRTSAAARPPAWHNPAVASCPAWPRCLARGAQRGVHVARPWRGSFAARQCGLRARVLAWCTRCLGAARHALGATRSAPPRS